MAGSRCEVICPECGHKLTPPAGRLVSLGPVTMNTGTLEVWVRGERRELQPAPAKMLARMLEGGPDLRWTNDALHNVLGVWEHADPTNLLAVYAHHIKGAVGDVLELSASRGYGRVLRVRASAEGASA